MKELSRRAMSNEEVGMACGPMGIYAVDAEIVVEDEGHVVYLHTQWVNEACDMILFEASTASLYDCYEELNGLADADMDVFNAAIEKHDQIEKEADIEIIFGEIDIQERYAIQYEQLVQMMQVVLDKDQVDFDLSEMEWRE